jgi:peptidyl-prolyl cis-trans isomerase C
MEDNKVLATVNGKDITEEDAYHFLNQLSPQVAIQYRTPEGIKNLVKELINQELFYLQAIEEELDREEEFIEQLEKIKKQVLIQYAVEKLFSGIEVEDEEINNYYMSNQESFIIPERVRASHILVDSEDEANEILNQLNSGMSFEEAARKYSKCPSKENGGDLGEFTRGQMVQEFEDAAFSMDEGQISEPIKTQFGYHIIKLVARRESEISPLEDEKEKIQSYLVALKQRELFNLRIDELKGKYEVNMYL